MLEPSKGSVGELPLKSIVEILSSLSNLDSLKIFLLSEKGIRNSTWARKELVLTQKRYYACLKNLVVAGLVEKKERMYKHTLLGTVCYKLGLGLHDTLLQGNRLKLANSLLSSQLMSAEEKRNVLYAISKKDRQGTFSIMDVLDDVKTITDYDVFIDEVVKMLDEAKESAYVATNKIDLRVSDSTLRIIDREVKLFFLSVEMRFSENVEVLRILMNPTSTRMIRRLLTSRELNIRVRKNLAYCFVVMDGKKGILELPHPLSQDFYIAFKFKNAYLGKKLIEVFNSLYEESKEDPRIAFIKKSLGLYKDLTGKIRTLYKDEA